MNLIKVAVIPTAGLGTRLLPATKQQPKEMLPVFVRNSNGLVFLKPVVQVAFERLYDAGLREFCFVVGRGKRSIEDQFTLDTGFMENLKKLAKPQLIKEMEHFYQRVQNSNIVFINQPEPLGFGDAVLRARAFTNRNPFIVHAGDDIIVSRNPAGCFHRLMTTFDAYQADAVFFVERVTDPRKYGVVEGDKIGRGTYLVKHVKEKPRHPKSKLAIVALYAFNERIYSCIEKGRQNRHRELELTDAIERLIKDGGKVYAAELEPHETRIDVGTPESYWNALSTTMRRAH
ncbi:MAG: sugar phosphate nucleotidyltransferase [Candidatus Bathyarchaeia archaeon]